MIRINLSQPKISGPFVIDVRDPRSQDPTFFEALPSRVPQEPPPSRYLVDECFPLLYLYGLFTTCIYLYLFHHCVEIKFIFCLFFSPLYLTTMCLSERNFITIWSNVTQLSHKYVMKSQPCRLGWQWELCCLGQKGIHISLLFNAVPIVSISAFNRGKSQRSPL